MAAIVSVISGHGFTIEECNKNQLALYKLLFHFNSHLKQLYISNKMEHFIYKDGCGAHGIHVLRHLKEELAWPTHKRL